MATTENYREREGRMSTSIEKTVAVGGPFQTYAAALLPFAVLLIGGFQTVLDNPGNWSVIVAFGLLILGNVVTFAVKIAPTGWHGRIKTGVSILFAILSAIAPFVLPGGFDPEVNTTLILVAVLNALSVELGVNIRTSPVADLRDAVGIPDISSIGVVTAADGTEHVGILPAELAADHYGPEHRAE